jgi:hypothetical protein
MAKLTVPLVIEAIKKVDPEMKPVRDFKPGALGRSGADSDSDPMLDAPIALCSTISNESLERKKPLFSAISAVMTPERSNPWNFNPPSTAWDHLSPWPREPFMPRKEAGHPP